MNLIFKNNKKIFFIIVFSVVLFSRTVFAMWNGTFYEPGDTLDPECLPTDVDCDVRSPLTSLNIDDSIYGAGWNADATHAPSKNAIYDKIESLGSGGTWGSITGTLSSQTDLQNILDLKATLASPTFTGTVTIPTGAIFNTPASMVGTNITGTASGLSIGGSAATLTTARSIYGNNFDGTANLAQIIASTFGGTGNGFTKFTGPTTAERTFTLPDSSATLLYSGGALGTPSSGTVTNLTGTASININGTVGATTPTTGAFTTATASTSVSTPSLITASGALTVTPTSGSNLNVSLATTGDFAVNTNQLYVDTSAASVGIGTASPNMALHIEGSLLGSYGMRIKNTSAASGFASAIYIAENDAGYTGQLFKTSSGYTGYKTVAANDLGFYNVGGGNISILNDYASGNINFAAGGSSTAQMTLLSTGKLGIGISPTAFLHLKAGTATANTAPLKFTAGTNLSTTEAGAIEYDGTHLYFTAANAGTRYQLDQQPVAVGAITGLGTGVSTALAINTGSAGAFVVNGGALGTPSSGTVTNLTGTASININGTVGATTPTTGAFTTATASTSVSTPSLITASGSLIITPASGNVGIGTTNPVAMLTVGGTQSGNAGFEIVPGSGIVFQAYNRTSSAYTSMKFDSLTVGFRPGGSEKVTIDSSGNVGIGDTTPDALLEAESSSVTGGNFLVTNTGIVTSGNVASVVANSLTTGVASAISTTGQTTGTGLSITGGGANILAGGELLDLQMGAATAGNAINIVNSGAYTGTGLLNITANGLTTGTAINVPHTTSVIANGGSLARLSSTSIDTSTTTGVLLDLSSTASLAGTQFLQTYSGLTTGIGEKIVANALTTGTAFIIPHTTSVIANGGSLARLSSTSIDTSTTTGVLLDLSSTASLAGTQFLQTYSGLTTGIGQSIVVNGLSSGTGLNISSTSTAATGNTQKLLNIALSGTNSTSAQTTYGAYISNTHAGTTSTNVGLYVTASGGTTANYALQAVGDISLTGGLTTIDNLAMGAMIFETDSGMVSWVDMPVTSSAAINTVESYTAQLDGNAALSIYSLSDGAGGIKTKNLAVGIGTATPLVRLDVAGSGRVTGTATSVLTGSINPTASTTVTGVGTLFTNELVVGDRITVSAETRTVTAIASATSLTVDTAFTDTADDTSPDKLNAIFVGRDSSNAVQFVINDLGWVGIGTASPGTVPLEVKGTATGGTIAKFTDTNTTGCTIADGGTISCSSDATLKKNIEVINYGLDTVMALRPVLYNWKYETDGSAKSLGFIAQEVEVLIPKLVSTDTLGMKSLNTTAMMPVLTKAIQEMNLNLEGIAGTIVPLAGSESESFVTAFFNNIYTKVGTWLASATNGITNIFAGEVETKSLCVADATGAKTCITKDQLDALILNAGISTPPPAPSPEPDPLVPSEPAEGEPAPEPVTAEGGTLQDAVAPEEVVPEPDSTSSPQAEPLVPSEPVEGEPTPEVTP